MKFFTHELVTMSGDLDKEYSDEERREAIRLNL